MALFPSIEGSYTLKGTSHTNLVVSEGNAPAEKWIVSATEGVKFQYVFGPRYNQNVVLAKGKVVDLAPAEFDYETGHDITAVKTAAKDSSNAVGVNLHNAYERKRDKFAGNSVAVITRNYIEVPLFENADINAASSYATAMNFGAAYGTNDANAFKPGDYVKVGDDGNYVKLDTATDSPFQKVGQVLMVEREIAPMGFLAYYMDQPIEELQQQIRDASHAPSPGKNGSDAGAYPYGYPIGLHQWKVNYEKLINPAVNTGIPFLTDGYFKSKQTFTGVPITQMYDIDSNPSGHIEMVTFSGDVTFVTEDTASNSMKPAAAGVVTDHVVVDANSRNAALFIKLHNPVITRDLIDKWEATPVVAHYTQDAIAGGVVTTGAAQDFSGKDVHIDYANNFVVLYLEPGKTYNNITLDLKLLVDPIAGIPTEWDYTGSVGAIRILLQK